MMNFINTNKPTNAKPVSSLTAAALWVYMLRGRVADFRLTVANFHWKDCVLKKKFAQNSATMREGFEKNYHKIKKILQFKIQVGDISNVVG